MERYPIEKLFDAKYAENFLKEKLPDLFAENNIANLKVTPIKNKIGKLSYHVVIRYDSKSLDGQAIFCSSHSEEKRSSSYEALNFIKKANPALKTPIPLFYDETLNAFFYLGPDGNNLLYYIRESSDLSDYLKQVAQWLAKFHEISVTKEQNFNPINSLIKTTLPGPDHFLKKIEIKFPNFLEQVKEYFEKLVAQEEYNLEKMEKRFLVHGDLHPENIIIDKNNQVNVIDFTDVSIGDWAKDMGAFIFQLDYMSGGVMDGGQVEKYKKIFLNEYFSKSGRFDNEENQKRISLYKNWAALRTVIYFLTKMPPEKENANMVIKTINLN